MEDIHYPEMREVLNNITYLRWPPKPSLALKMALRNKFKQFWKTLYINIVKKDNKIYPNVTFITANRNVPI